MGIKMSEKSDYTKEYKEFYLPGKKPSIIQIPAMNFIMVEGKGNPNTSEEYKQAIEILYGLSYGIKMSKKNGTQPEGYYDYRVFPLEGLWRMPGEAFDGLNSVVLDKEAFEWTAMIRQPEFVTEQVYETAKAGLKKKKPEIDFSNTRYCRWEEGVCVQMMHHGPYDDEPVSIRFMNAFIEEAGYITDITEERPHHEIYLGDPRKTKPENLKTVLRHPVRKKETA